MLGLLAHAHASHQPHHAAAAGTHAARQGPAQGTHHAGGCVGNGGEGEDGVNVWRHVDVGTCPDQGMHRAGVCVDVQGCGRGWHVNLWRRLGSGCPQPSVHHLRQPALRPHTCSHLADRHHLTHHGVTLLHAADDAGGLSLLLRGLLHGRAVPRLRRLPSASGHPGDEKVRERKGDASSQQCPWTSMKYGYTKGQKG